MPSARGRLASLVGGYQPDLVTPASTGRLLPFYTEGFNDPDGFEQDPEIQGAEHNARDASDPAPTLRGVSTGPMVVAADMNNLAFWLPLLLGDPVVSGAGPYIRDYESGKLDLGFATIEAAIGTDRWKAMIGVQANSWEFSFDKETGYKQMTFGMQAREVRPLTGAGNSLISSAPEQALPRAKAVGSLARLSINGAVVGRATGGSFSYQNNTEAVNYADGSPFPGELEPGDSSVTLTPRIRLDQNAAGNTILDLFQGSGPGRDFHATVMLDIDANNKLIIDLPRCFAPRRVPVIGGRGPLEFEASIEASQTTTDPAMRVQLVNTIETL